MSDKVVTFRSKVTGADRLERGDVSAELLAMANRLEEIANSSNMPVWGRLLANEVRSMSRSYQPDAQGAQKT